MDNVTACNPMGCGNKVPAITPGGKEYSFVCGSYEVGRKRLCRECEKIAESEYPQGWIGYPGDTCSHGVYVGGCMDDNICGKCESYYEGMDPQNDESIQEEEFALARERAKKLLEDPEAYFSEIDKGSEKDD